MKQINFSLLLRLTVVLILINTLVSLAYFEENVDEPFEPILVQDHIIVNFNSSILDINPIVIDGIATLNVDSLDRIADRFGVYMMRKQFPGAEIPDNPDEIDLSGFYVVYFDKNKGTVDEIRSEYEKNQYVIHTEPDHIVRAMITPNDPYLSSQWGISKIECEDGWDIERGSDHSIVAIVDSGVDWQHPDLNDAIWDNTDESVNGSDSDGNGYVDDIRGWDFVAYSSSCAPGEDGSVEDNNPMDWHGHGTHCAGIASAETNNNTGIAGTGWGAQIMALRVAWEANDGRAYTYMNFVASAFYYAANNGANIINLSYGSSNSGGISSATNYAINTKDCLICVSAGNSGGIVTGYLQGRSDVMCVAASTSTDRKPGWSSYGNAVDVTAPGQGIYSTIRVHGGAHTYDYMSGTSMSSPMVCGEAALIRAHWPGWSWSQTFDRIVDYVDDMPNEPQWVQGKMGSGRINVYKALSGDDPIILTYFTAEEMDGDVLLKWDVDWMENVDGFNIYRKELNDTKTEMEKSLFENNSDGIKINEQMITGSPPYSFLDRELEEGSYRYYLVAVENQSEDEISEASVDVNGMPMSFRISSIYPNPLVDSGTVMLTLSESTDVSIEIYDISGRLVHKVYDGCIEEGEHSIDVNFNGLSNGLYILKASDENSVDQKKFVVVH